MIQSETVSKLKEMLGHCSSLCKSIADLVADDSVMCQAYEAHLVIQDLLSVIPDGELVTKMVSA